MLEILGIASSVPTRQQSIDEASAELKLSNKDRRMYERFFGLARLPHDPDQPLNAMVSDACSLLDMATAPDMVVHCHTLLSSGPCRSDALLPVDFYRGSVAEVFSATMCHCASGVAVLDLMERILPDGATALVIVADKAFHPAVRLIRNTTIMGDGAVAMLVGHRPGRFAYVAGYTLRFGQYSIITGRPGEETDNEFADEYLDFTARCIRVALARAGISVGDLKLLLPHNVNLPSWDQIAQRIGASPEQIFLANVPRYGHMFGADPFLNLADADRSGLITPGDHIALVSVGLGATASCAILKAGNSVDAGATQWPRFPSTEITMQTGA